MSNKPVKEIASGRGVKIAIWDNGEKGKSLTIQPPQYKDENGEWKNGSFYPTDMPGLAWAIQRTLVWLANQEGDRVS